jgi:hypothetical protein
MTAINFVAVTNWSSAPDLDVMFAVEAARKELPRFCAAWGLPVPGIAFFSKDVELPAKEAMIVSAVDEDGQAGTLGYHTTVAGLPLFIWEQRYGTPVFTHELFETLANPLLDRWATAPDGHRFWVEACDGCQGDSYPVDVEVSGNFSSVLVSNWLRPEWFLLESHDGLTGFDAMSLCDGPFGVRPGGYSVTETPDGQRQQVGGDRADKGRSTSRTALLAARSAQSLR